MFGNKQESAILSSHFLFNVRKSIPVKQLVIGACLSNIQAASI